MAWVRARMMQSVVAPPAATLMAEGVNCSAPFIPLRTLVYPRVCGGT